METTLIIISICTILLNIANILFLLFTKIKIELKSIWMFFLSLIPCYALTVVASIKDGTTILTSILTSFYNALSFYKFSFPKVVENVANGNELFAIASFIACIATAYNYVILLVKAIIKDKISLKKIKKNAHKPHYILLGEFSLMKQVCSSLNLDAYIIIEEGCKPKKGFNLSIDEIKKIISNEEKNNVREHKTLNYEYIFTENIEEALVTAGLDNEGIKVISLYEDIDKTFNLIKIADKHLKESSVLLVNTDLKKLKLENKKYEIRFFDIHDLIANYFIINYPLYSYLPDDLINRDKALLTFDKLNKQTNKNNNRGISHIFIGSSKDTVALFKNIEMNYLSFSLKINASFITNENIKNEIDLLNSNNNFIKRINNLNETYYDLFYIKDNLHYYNLDGNIIAHCLEDALDYTFFYIDLENDEQNYNYARLLLENVSDKLKGNLKIFVKNIKSNDIKMTLEKEGVVVINVEDKILSKQFIVDEQLDNIAKKVHEYYSKKYNSEAKNKTMDELWLDADYTDRESSRQAVNSISVKLSLLGLKLANKEEKIENDELSQEEFDSICVKQKDFDYLNYQYDSNYNNLLLHEHNRWAAYKVILDNNLPLEKSLIFEEKEDQTIFNHRIGNRHSNLFSIKGLYDLTKDIQTKENVNYGSSSKEDEMRIFEKDGDLIDNLYHLLEGTGYYVSKK